LRIYSQIDGVFQSIFRILGAGDILRNLQISANYSYLCDTPNLATAIVLLILISCYLKNIDNLVNYKKYSKRFDTFVIIKQNAFKIFLGTLCN